MSLTTQEHSFNAGPVTLNYVEGPASGPLLVLLHGGSARWQAFESIIPDLADRWHLYGPDFRGHGKSPFDTRSTSFCVTQDDFSRIPSSLEHSKGYIEAVSCDRRKCRRGCIIELSNSG